MLNYTVTLATKTDMDTKVRPLYDTPRRFYHTHRHAVDVAYAAMHISRQMRFTADERMEYLPERVADTLWVAGMWHDAIYVVGAPDNEELSAIALLSHYPEMVVAADLIKKTTIADHFDESITWEENPMLCCLLDADIRSLSYSYDRFVAAQLEIAAEHGAYEITIAHVDFLKRFLAKNRIYRAPMSDTKEENARENINILIDQIAQS